MTYSLEQLHASQLSLVITKDDVVIFESKSSGLDPLIEFIKSHETIPTGLTIYDKYVGRAAALLMVLIKPDKVCVGIISKFGVETFEQYKIAFDADEQVDYLMGVASEGMCRFEKLSVGKTPDELWQLVSQD